SKNPSKMTGSYMCDAHALAFNTLLSSQETDANFIGQIRSDLASEALSRLRNPSSSSDFVSNPET
ncbi:hypothetical protein, partial [Nonomuraea wenchangensis]|uniref:hypothetical protein n=1 Tax=Nonomuraea wenchangensis TaxID=568860 RepID=UPI001C434200